VGVETSWSSRRPSWYWASWSMEEGG
jgi:hypothetical protein